MKKLIYKIALFLLTLFVFVSCSKDEFLDIDPQGIKIPSTIEDYRLLLDDASTFTQKHNVPAYASDHVFASVDLNSDIGYEEEELNQYLFKDFIYRATNNDIAWNDYYTQIFNVNIILDGLSKLVEQNGASEEINQLEAEAKLQRAYAYFNLVNIYSVHYDPATAATDLGVPIREGFSLFNVDLTRASVQAVYDLMLDDIMPSIAFLKDTQSLPFSFRPSKAGAYTLLSKVYLFQARYEESLQNIEKALAIYSTLSDFNEDNNNVKGTPPVRVFPNVFEDSQIVWHKNSFIDLSLTEEYVNLFDEDDLRKQWFSFYPEIFKDDPVLKNVNAYFFEANQCQNCSSEGIYTSEMYLIRAECNARLGSLIEANSDLNILREKRYKTGTYTMLNITDQDELLRFVKAERQREFPVPVDRSFDIKRYNRFDNDNISITHTYAGETVTILPNAKNWAQPIGQLYINFNPEIQPNPRD